MQNYTHNYFIINLHLLHIDLVILDKFKLTYCFINILENACVKVVLSYQLSVSCKMCVTVSYTMYNVGPTYQ